MSKFDVQVRRIAAVEPHPNADALEFVRIMGYQSIVKKGQYKAGDLVVYLPEAAILPEFVLRVVGLWGDASGIGLCAGPKGDRVKTVKLRGSISQGVVYPLSYLEDHPFGPGWYLQDSEMGLWKVDEGQDVAGLLGVTKHIPAIPDELAGAVMAVGRHLLPFLDIEDIKKYPDIIQEGEEVAFTEKLHGIFTGAVWLPEKDAVAGKRFFVFGKGIGEQGLAFIDDESNKENIYLQMAHKFGLEGRVKQLAERLDETSVPVFLLGETFGIGVQDLGYGMKPTFRGHVIGAGYRGQEQCLDYDSALEHAKAVGVDWVPEIYRGPFSHKILAERVSGKETLTGKQVHIREGVVIVPVVERTHHSLGRVVLKAISPEYTTRKGNTTEYQ